MAETREFSVSCPHCGATGVRLRSEAFALVEVFEWELQDGIPVAIDTDNPSADWEPAERGPQYECLMCEWRGMGDDLRVTDASAPAEEGR